MSDFRYSIPVMEAHRQRDDVKRSLPARIIGEVLDRIGQKVLCHHQLPEIAGILKGAVVGWKPANKCWRLSDR